MTFIGAARKIISVVMTFVLTLFMRAGTVPEYTVLDEDSCQLCAAVFADVHLEGNNLPRYKLFNSILTKAKRNSFGNDVAVFLGDSTMNGQEIESLLFYGLVRRADIADETVVVCGNHDLGNGQGDYDTLINRFMGFNNALLGEKLDKPYYYKIINGYYFITIAPDGMCVNSFSISDEQLRSLDEILDIATEDGKPAFVCAHHPWNYADGDCYNELYRVLSSHDNIFYLAGHTHLPCYEGWTFNQMGGINNINLPRCTELYGENDNEIGDEAGYAVQLEVYPDEVVGRVRNYYTGEWVDSLEYHFELV